MRSETPSRALASLVGVLALLAITIVLAVIVAVSVGFAGDAVLESGPDAVFDLEADAEGSELTLEHVGGEPIDVADMELRIAVNGDRLEHQPPVPFVGADGFRGAPSGPFNSESDSEWVVGEKGSLRVARTNEPTVQSGDTVTVTVVVNGQRVAVLEATAR